MRLVDADKLYPDVMKVDGSMAISQGQLAHAKTVEAIPKADYENRLKADMVAMLTELQLEIEERYPKCDLCEYFVDYDYDENDISEYRSVGSITDITDLIQQKINSLKEKS